MDDFEHVRYGPLKLRTLRGSVFQLQYHHAIMSY